MTRGSWKHEFDVKYRRALNTSDNRIIDNANIIVLTAVDNLDAMMKCVKSGRFWNPKTNKCKSRK